MPKDALFGWHSLNRSCHWGTRTSVGVGNKRNCIIVLHSNDLTVVYFSYNIPCTLGIVDTTIILHVKICSNEQY